MDVLVWGEEVVHDHEVDLAPAGKLDTMKAVESRDECMRVTLDMLIVLLENPSEELVLVVVDRLDDEPVVPREVEERSGLARRPKFRQDVFGSERKQVIGGIEMEMVLP